jgi:universal stress protein E
VKEIIDTTRQQHQEALDQLMTDYSIPSDHIQFQQGPPHHALVALAIQRDADFVVMGAVSRSASGSVFLGGTAERVLDHIPCDLLLIKPPNFERIEL